MATAYQGKTYPEILAEMQATVLAAFERGDLDFNDGAVILSILEAAALQDADQHIQIARVLDLFSIDTCRGDDLDRRAQDFGTAFFKPLRRNPAQTSISYITVSDGAKILKVYSVGDVSQGATTFNVQAGTGASFPSSGSAVIERGTNREEKIVFTVSGDTFTVIQPSGVTPGLAFGHASGSEILLVATQSYLTVVLNVAGTTATLVTGTGAAFPASGTAIFDRGTVFEEKIAYTRTGDVLTLSVGATKKHNVGGSVILSTVGTDRKITTGSICFAPATDANVQVNFSTTADGTLYDGDLTSDLIPVESEKVGADTRVGANFLTQWKQPPFPNATVTNPIAATRGADRENDDSYRQRIREFIQSLTRATPLSIVTLVTGLKDPVTQQSVAFAQIVEPVLPGVSHLYITDGTSVFTLTQQVFSGRDVLISDAALGDRRGKLSQYGPFNVVVSPANQRTPRIFKSITGIQGVATLVGTNFLENNTLGMTPNAYVGMWLKTDDNQFYQITSNSAIRFNLNAGGSTPGLGAYAIFDFTQAPLIPGTDFNFNEATGDLELAIGLALQPHESLVAASDGALPSVGAYTYTVGLGAYVQRVVNGDPIDFNNFPGLRASGTQVLVMAPVIVSPSFIIQIVPAPGFSDSQLRPLVQHITQTYVNSLGIGKRGKIVLSEIVRLVKALPGLAGNEGDVVILSPPANFPVADGQMPRITDANVTVV